MIHHSAPVNPTRPPRLVLSAATIERHEVVVIGGGLSGLGTVVAMKQAGVHDVVVLEKGASLGGTWRDNTYPGCACDVPSVLYSFGFAPSADWTRVFATQPEIRDYVERIARDFDVMDRIRLGVEVLAARWIEARQCWRIETNTGVLEARVLVAAAGPLHEPVIPALPGLDRFRGTVFHSARWNHDHDLAGRRVAVVGTGASAVQFVPVIQPRVARLHLFQRTPSWVLPKPDAPIGPRVRALYRRVPLVQRALRNTLYHALELLQLAQRHPSVMHGLAGLGRAHLRRGVRDPALRARLTPSFALGCKRILLSNTYYPALSQPNVDVVPHAVREVRAHSVVAADGIEREVDTIVFATGFHVTDPPIATRLRGRDGALLSDVWNGSPQAHLGTTVHGFPNLFLMIGPNLGNGHGSALVLVEAQLKYVLSALDTMRTQGLGTVDVRAEVQSRYNADVQRALAGTVWNAGGCASYYLDVHGRNSSIYPWTTLDLRRRTARFDVEAHATTPVHTITETVPDSAR